MRGNRILRPDAVYHVTARANRKEMILSCDAMRALFLATIKRAKQKFRFQVHNFCVMGNHIHLILRPERGESLSRIMQWILSVFAMAWNRSHFVSGHVWGERIFSKIIDSMREYIKTFVYVTHNPVSARLAERIDEWQFGGLWHFIISEREILEGLPCYAAFLYHWHYRLVMLHEDKA
jgi:putative transposase